MSEAVKIKEGGVDRSQNQIDKLKTNMQGGGVCYWVPETERETDSKSIDKNGTYTAEEEGLYGFSVLNVSVPSSSGVSGKDDVGGNDYNVNVDGDGYLTENKIPSYIEIISPPGKLDYTDGETIDLTGIVAKAYDAEGNEMQTLTVADLVNSPLYADKSQTSGEGTATYDDIEVSFTTELHRTQYMGDRFCREVTWTTEDGVYIVESFGTLYAASREPKRVWYEIGEWEHPYEPKPSPSGGFVNLELDYQKNAIDGSDVYIATRIEGSDWTDSGYWRVVDEPTITNPRTNPSPLHIVLAGERTGGGTQKITVTWYRTGDMKPLSDTFDIHVEDVEAGG